jgi:hypothetical protein
MSKAHEGAKRKSVNQNELIKKSKSQKIAGTSNHEKIHREKVD